MRYCPECGHKVDEDMKFCPECGRMLMGEKTKQDTIPSMFKPEFPMGFGGSVMPEDIRRIQAVIEEATMEIRKKNLQAYVTQNYRIDKEGRYYMYQVTPDGAIRNTYLECTNDEEFKEYIIQKTLKEFSNNE